MKIIEMEKPPVKQLKLWPAIITGKCPRCRVGNIYKKPMYALFGQKMNTTCPHCGFVFEREPGYFYAAMYVSYAFIVAELVTLAIGTSILTGSHNPWLYIVILLSVTSVLSPYNLRYSRVLLLLLFTPGIKYKPELSADHDHAA